MRKFLMVTVFVLAVCAAAGFWALQSPRASEALARYAFKRYCPRIQLTALSIGRQRMQGPEITWASVKATLTLPSEEGKASATVQADLDQLTVFMLSRRALRLEMQGLHVVTGTHDIQGLNVMLHGERDARGGIAFSGGLNASSVEAGKVLVSGMSARVQGDARAVTFQDVQAQAYGGRLAGEISLAYAPRLTYGIQLQMQNLDCRQLKTVQSGLFGALQGPLDGTVHLEGAGEDVQALEVDAALTGGGAIRAALLSFVTRYIPTSVDRDYLLALIRKDAMLPVEKATLRLSTVDSRTLSGEAHLESRVLKINFNIPLDIRFDGNVWSLLRSDAFSLGD